MKVTRTRAVLGVDLCLIKNISRNNRNGYNDPTDAILFSPIQTLTVGSRITLDLLTFALQWQHKALAGFTWIFKYLPPVGTFTPP